MKLSVRSTLVLTVLTLTLLINSCATGTKIRQLQPGMNRNQVLKKLGPADGFRQSGEYYIYSYTNRLMNDVWNTKADYAVIFKGEELVEYGVGEVRENRNNGVHTLFIFQP